MPLCCNFGSSEESKGFEGPKSWKERSCTDLLCLLIFIAFCMIGFAVGLVGMEYGQPESLVFGKDDNGNICGSENKKIPLCKQEQCFTATGEQIKDEATGKMVWAHTVKKDKSTAINYKSIANDKTNPPKYVMYPRLVEDLFDSAQQVPPVTPLQTKFFGICVDKCPTKSGWTCSPYGKGYLADTLEMTAFPTDLSEKECKNSDGSKTCVSELNECRDNGILNPSMPVSMHKYKSEKCSKLLKSCFFSSLPHTDTMFRCFPMYKNNVSYACDDNNDGLPDADFLGLDGKPMNGNWQEEPFNEDQITLCGTMIKKSLSQQSASPNIVYQQIASAVAVIGRMISDLQSGMISIVICGIGISVVCGFLWLILLRYCARVFVWVTIILVVIMETSLCVFFYIQAGMINVNPPSTAPAPGTTSGVITPPEIANDGNTNTEMFKWAAIGMTILLVIQFMGIIAAIKKINVAAEIISEASKAVAAMRSLMAFPMFPVVLISGIFLWFIYISVCLYSIGEISGDALIDVANKYSGPQNLTTPIIVNNTKTGNSSNTPFFSGVNMTASTSFKEADWGKYLMLVHVFVALWGNAFVQGFMTMTIANAVSNWYFEKPDDNGDKNLENLPVPRACGTIATKHLGSVAFGSGIIAAVQLMRAIMMYIDSQTKTLQDKNICLKILMKMVHCILWCFDKCVKYLTKNAYIFVAIKGDAFCFAAKDVFVCLKDNMGQMAVVAGVTGYLMLIGKVVIVASASFVCYLMTMSDVNISSPALPVLVTALLAFFVASVFLDVYAISIDTILISFCIDKKQNDGKKNKYYMSNKMRKLAGIEGDENSCYKRSDAGKDDDNVEAIGADDNSDNDNKSSETEKPTKVVPKFDTDNDLI